jgi:hypothetical protein
MIETIYIYAAILLFAVIKDYIPGPDSEFDEWQDNFIEVLNALVADGKLLAADIATLIPLQADWVAKYAVGGKEANPRSSDRIAKTDSRKLYVKEIRKVVKDKINTKSTITNEDRTALGITVYDTVKTRVPVPAMAPAGKVEKINPGEHIIRNTNPDTPASRAKPKGVSGARVFRFIGTAAPASPTDYVYIGIAKRVKFKSTFNATDAGKKAFYILQYENTRGETGPLGSMFSETIA